MESDEKSVFQICDIAQRFAPEYDIEVIYKTLMEKGI